MKICLTILLVFLILLSGMHLTVSTHHCGGKVAATKLSFSGKLATCGMSSDNESRASSEISFTSKCCENEISVYSIDNNYAPSEFQFKQITKNILHKFCISEEVSFYSYVPPLIIDTNVSPPDNYLVSSVSMAGICVFRI
jgi:hypothetical protein